MPKSSSLLRRRRFPSLFAALALVAFVAACDSSTGNDDDPETLAVNPVAPTMRIGTTQQLVATPATSGGRIIEGLNTSWSSSNDAVATVSAEGLVTAVSGGTATITATAGGLSADAAVTVWFPVTSVAITPAGGLTTIKQEASLQLTPSAIANGVAAPGRQYSWTSSDPSVAVVSTTGRVTAQGVNGTAIITATAEGVSNTFNLTVFGDPDVATVAIASTSGRYMADTNTDQYTIVAQAASGRTLSLTGRTVVWTAGTPANATVSASGLVTKVGNTGTSTIRASVDGVNSNTVTVVGATPLTSGVAVVNGTIASDASAFFVITVPAGATNLSVVTSGGNADPDLFLYSPSNQGTAATLPATATCSSENGGPGESCVRATPAAGRWLARIYAWPGTGGGAATGTTITATVTP